MDALKTLDSELADLVPDEELEEEIRVVDKYKNNIYEALTKIDKALKTATTPATPTPVVAHPSSPSPVEHCQSLILPLCPLLIQQDPSWPPRLLWTKSTSQNYFPTLQRGLYEVDSVLGHIQFGCSHQ